MLENGLNSPSPMWMQECERRTYSSLRLSRFSLFFSRLCFYLLGLSCLPLCLVPESGFISGA